MPRAPVLIASLLAACTGIDKDTGPPDDGQPHITIVSPAESADVGGCFNLSVQVRNFTLINPVDESTAVDGHGHWHAIFGPRYFDCESEDCEIALTEDAAGDVTVEALLVDSTHAPVLNDDAEEVSDTRILAFDGTECPDSGD
jgi:hypothetical protein